MRTSQWCKSRFKSPRYNRRDTRKSENPLSSLEPLQSNDLVTDRLGEESQKTTLKCVAVSEDFNSHEPAFSITEEDSSNLCSELCDSIRTSSQESIEICDVVSSYDTNNYSSSPTEIECSKLGDSSASPGSTKWTETSQHYHLRSVEDGDWESIYDDRGECLLPSVGSVNPYSPEVVKKDVQMKALDKKEGDDDDQPHETSSIIEIYGFSEDLKTNDILNAFGNWNQRGFNLKWVDNTHALGIFPTPALAEEVLSSNIPIVKIRPISQGTTLSQERAKTLVLPSSLRPKTCTALARRLVSGALGLRVNVTPEERAAERELLREAREKKKLALKQRDAAWEGNFSSLECSEEKASN
uniref:Growth inhibition and differentiation-related protein 88 n=1 Tax=Lygus hesperus TaxID=30085 RepID=A0A0A9YHU6_LYGHE